jgi:hypothetical protein
MNPVKAEKNRLWSMCSWAILIATFGLTLIVFARAPLMCGGIHPLTAKHLVDWLRWLDVIALVSTISWSVVAFFGIFSGPHTLWDVKEFIGRKVFMASSLYFLAIMSCMLGIYFVYEGYVSLHILCIIAAEGLFWYFDVVLIKSIDAAQERAANFDSWAIKRKQQLQAWISFVDRPAVAAFSVLLFGGGYLKCSGVLISELEVELFSTGAVFFALMAANLAFFSANLTFEKESSSVLRDHPNPQGNSSASTGEAVEA